LKSFLFLGWTKQGPSDMIWLLVEDDVDVLHIEIYHVIEISIIRDIDMSS
jgi:hypothetical protein